MVNPLARHVRDRQFDSDRGHQVQYWCNGKHTSVKPEVEVRLLYTACRDYGVNGNMQRSDRCAPGSTPGGPPHNNLCWCNGKHLGWNSPRKRFDSFAQDSLGSYFNGRMVCLEHTDPSSILGDPLTPKQKQQAALVHRLACGPLAEKGVRLPCAALWDYISMAE